ncbi:hypothetical protein BH11BAC3_BH11BAC3_47270 [soil metagenome]
MVEDLWLRIPSCSSSSLLIFVIKGCPIIEFLVTLFYLQSNKRRCCKANTMVLPKAISYKVTNVYTLSGLGNFTPPALTYLMSINFQETCTNVGQSTFLNAWTKMGIFIPFVFDRNRLAQNQANIF